MRVLPTIVLALAISFVCSVVMELSGAGYEVATFTLSCFTLAHVIWLGEKKK